MHNKQHNAIVPVSCGLKCHLCFNVHEDIMNFVLKCEHVLSGVMMIMYVCSRVSAVVGKSNSYYAGWIEDFIPPFTSAWPHLRCDVGLEEGEYRENCLCLAVLCIIIMVHKDKSSSYRAVNCIGL